MSETTNSSTSASLLQAMGHPLSDRRLQVLRALGECGSISQAARQVGVSYKAAWQAIDTLGNLAGVPVVQKSVGGAGGGGAKLTDAGRDLLRAAEAMVQVRGAVLQHIHTTQGLDGALVQRLQTQTSMRNQWPCVVEKVELAGPLARVHLRSQHADWTLLARITAESAQLLGLQVGLPVLAWCKATAVQIAGMDTLLAPSNVWACKVARVAAGDMGDEVAVELGGQVRLVGFSAARTGWRAGRKVQAYVPESAVVLALGA